MSFKNITSDWFVETHVTLAGKMRLKILLTSTYDIILPFGSTFYCVVDVLLSAMTVIKASVKVK